MRTYVAMYQNGDQDVVVPAAIARGLYDALKDALDNYGYEGFDGDDYDRYSAALSAADGEDV